mgnify:FL=1
MPPFYHPIALRSIRCGSTTSSTQKICEGRYQRGLKLLVLVSGDAMGATKTRNPDCVEGFRHRLRCHVCHRYYFWPSGKPVCHREAVPVFLRCARVQISILEVRNALEVFLYAYLPLIVSKVSIRAQAFVHCVPCVVTQNFFAPP